MARLGLSFLLMSMISLARAEDHTVALDSHVHGLNTITFSRYQAPGGQGVRAALSGPGGAAYQLSGRCEPEGGDPDVLTAFTLKEHGQTALVYVCTWRVDHSGLGIKGVAYRGFVYTETSDGKLHENPALENLFAGYEGSTEAGARDYFFYGTHDLLTRRARDSLSGTGDESLSTAHSVVLQRLADLDYDGITGYLTADRLTALLQREPLGRTNVVFYNDIGYALGQAGAFSASYKLLSQVESVVPDRMVLKLNIADALWGLQDKEKARDYYRQYVLEMTGTGKRLEIPGEVLIRAQ